MKIIIICIILFLLITASSCSTQTKESSIQTVSIETPFELKVGETASVEGHEFTFIEVRSDSRCPSDALCIWAGEATVVLSPQDEGDLLFTDVLLSTNTTEAYTYLFPDSTNNSLSSLPYTLGYLVQLNSLTPLPKVGEELGKEEYTATFTIFLSI